MGFEEVRFINSDFKNEPLNYLNYIDSIEKLGDQSYILQPENETLFRELLCNSSMIWSHRNIVNTIYDRLTDDDAKYILRNHPKAGTILNVLAGDTVFSTGNIDNICEYMNMNAIHALPDKFFTPFTDYVTEKMHADDCLDWIKEKYNLDLSEYETLSGAIQSQDGWTALLTSDPFMSTVCMSPWFVNEIVDTSYMIIYRSTDGTYYDENGTQYSEETNETTGSTIPVNTLQMMIEANLLTEDKITVQDEVHEKFNAAISYICQNNALSAFNDKPELVKIAVNSTECCEYMRDNPDTCLATLMENSEFAKQILTTETTLNTIAESDEACKVIVDFIAKIQDSYDAMSDVADAFSAIVEKGDKIYNYEPIKNQMQATLTDVNARVTDLTDVQDYTKLTQDMVDAICDNEEYLTSILGNTNFVAAAADNKTFSEQIVSKENPATVLSSDRRTYPIALAHETFVQAMIDITDNYEGILIADAERRTDIYNTENALTMLGKNEACTRRMINKVLNLNDSSYSDLNTDIGTTAWINALMSSSVLSNFAIYSASFLNLIRDNSDGIELLVNSSAMQTAVTSRVSMKALCGSATSMAAIIANETALGLMTGASEAMAECGDSTIAMKAMVNSTAAMTSAANSTIGMKELAASQTAMEAIVANSTALSTVCGNSTSAEEITNSETAMNVISASTLGRNTIVSNSVIYKMISAKEMAITKFMAGCAGLTTADYSDIASILADTNALNNVCNSSVARDILLTDEAIEVYDSFIEDYVAIGKLIIGLINESVNDYGNMDVVVSTSSIREKILANTDAYKAMTYSSIGVAKFAAAEAGLNPGDYADINELAANDTARSAVEDNTTAFKVISDSPVGTIKFTVADGGLNPMDYSDVSDLVQSVEAMNIVMTNADARNAMIASDIEYTAMNESSIATAKYAVAEAGLEPSDYADMDILATSEVGMSAVAASSTAMKAIADSTVSVSSIITAKDVGLATCVGSTTAMTALVSSTTSMDVIANSDVAVSAIINNTTALSTMVSSSTGIKAIANSKSAMSLMAASTTAVTDIIGNSTALSTCTSSTTAMEALCANSDAMSTIAGNATAMASVVASTTAMTAVCASSTASKAIAASSTAMTKLVANTTAMSKVAASKTAMTEMAASTTAMNKIVATKAAFTAVAKSTTAKNAVLASSTALNVLDNYSSATTMTEAGTVSGVGFIISYSLEANQSRWGGSGFCRGGFALTADGSNIIKRSSVDNSTSELTAITETGGHILFASLFTLTFSYGIVEDSAGYCQATAVSTGTIKYYTL